MKLREATAEHRKTEIPASFHPAEVAPPPQKYMGWLPDWRDASAYPSAEASASQLGWELLRRNRIFQQQCLAAQGSTRKEAAVCKAWRLKRFKLFWEPSSSEESLFVDEDVERKAVKGEDESPLIASSEFLGERKLLLTLDLKALGASGAKRDALFASLRTFIEARAAVSPPVDMGQSKDVWTSKVPRHLRLIDALSQSSPVSRETIGSQFHHERLILIEHYPAWSPEKVISAAREQLGSVDASERASMIEEEIEEQLQRKRRLAKKYSKEIGAQIARAYHLVYEQGYSGLKQRPSPTDAGSSRYAPSKKSLPGDGLFEKARRLLRNRSWG
ncbi:hypothetical protein D3C87_1105800 [compost metagenome]